MAAKKTGYGGTVVSIIFTSVLGPLLVQFVMNNLKNESTPPATPTLAEAWTTPSVPIRLPEQSVLAEGIGDTPESAWDDAVRNGLRAAALVLMDAETRNREGAQVWAAVLEDPRGLITRCEDLACTGRAGIWRREVAVFIDRAALANRLHSTRLRLSGVTS